MILLKSIILYILLSKLRDLLIRIISLKTIKQFGKHIENIAIIAIVDAERWEEIMKFLKILMTVQIKNADIIL